MAFLDRNERAATRRRHLAAGRQLGFDDRTVIGRLHDPRAQLQRAVAAQVVATLREDLGINDTWEHPDFVGLNRFVLRYNALSKHGDKPGNALAVRAPQPMALGVQDALLRLQLMVAGW